MAYETLKNNLQTDVAGMCAGHKTKNAARILSRRYEEALRPSGLKSGQYTMLVVIAVTEDRTLTELAGHMGLERTTLIRNLKPLERDGLVTISDEGYRRARTVEVTDQGYAKLQTALPLWREAQASVRAELGDEVWKSVHQSLEALNSLK